MNITSKEYAQRVKKASPPSKHLKNFINAFWIGGLICVVGECFSKLYTGLGLAEKAAGSATSATMIFFGVLLTALHLYDNIAKVAGAGTVVPITGFANAMTAPAIEFKSEGLVLGMAAKMFSIAGPVIVYGVGASVIYGVIYWIFS